MTTPTMPLGTLLQRAADRLSTAGVEHPGLDAEWLVMTVLGCDRTRLITHTHDPVPPDQVRRVEAAVTRRVAGEPIQYILGRCNFWKDVFTVTPAVLIPRPETELLVEQGALSLRGIAAPRILDLASGSGCVGLSLLRECVDARVTATDLSPAAARVARRNADDLELADRFDVVVGDGPVVVGRRRGHFDLVVANPPYVSEAEYEQAPQEVREWEPSGALLGGADGLDFYRRWVPACLELVRPGQPVMMEFGWGQWNALETILAGLGADYGMWRDLQSIPRVFWIKAPAAARPERI